ncbi:hypothetical protein [Streptomyces jeddahensis]|uniref:Uncharacterized protein n=1 Tax=Streptomyces jeddahensis TaxID=1716141 RepID=A0A177HU58_9ACTN|nr:hypothetical protein [Streptomyces jeddahensis]OAH14067.1 hypothetical protein STSP_25150 [Streptomyces jeddahensis]
MSSSGLIYAVIVGAWAAYLVPMWLRRQDELNEARPTERFSTAIRLLSGRAGMERRYAKDLEARSAGEADPRVDPDDVTDSVDVRAFAVSPSRKEVPRARRERHDAAGAARRDESRDAALREGRETSEGRGAGLREGRGARGDDRGVARRDDRGVARDDRGVARDDRGAVRREDRGDAPRDAREDAPRPETGAPAAPRATSKGRSRVHAEARTQPPKVHAQARPADGSPTREVSRQEPSPARRAATRDAVARAQRSKVLARRRRTTVVLFFAFTLGAIVAAVGGLAFLWAPAVPALLLSGYIAHLRSQERRRFTYVMDRRRAEAAAQSLRERERQPRRRPPADGPAGDETEEESAPAAGPDLSALAADRRAIVEQTDHAEWLDQQREQPCGPGNGDSWEPVPVPLPTYVTAPVAPRAAGGVDLGAPDVWSSARSSAAEPATGGAADRADRPGSPEGADRSARVPGPASGADRDHGAAAGQDPAGDAGAGAQGHAAAGPSAEGQDGGADAQEAAAGDRSDARRAASARRSRERGRTPLFDQYADGDRPRAANE